MVRRAKISTLKKMTMPQLEQRIDNLLEDRRFGRTASIRRRAKKEYIKTNRIFNQRWKKGKKRIIKHYKLEEL